MLETATNDTDLRDAYDRAHALRASEFLAVLRMLRSIPGRPTPKRNGADLFSQPRNCDCPA